ncbi:MAG: thiamine pyrophosphate-binding protein, partial [Actinomycetota bacterium]|nr:thiamine pyrophosphate-binding protein [Actinomycetota bacterium]
MTGRDNTLWIALESLGIHQVLARSEATAVYMADAYARLRGRPTFAYGAYGPGAANVAGALAEPLWSSSPVIALVSAMRRGERFRKEYQELDQIPLFASVTKWGVEAAVAAQVPRLIREAARHSISGTPGPVYLGIPGDIFEDEVPDYQEPEAPGQLTATARSRPAPTDADATEAVRVLASANRPVIVAGNGIHNSDAYTALREVAERLAIPIATSSAGKGSIAETHDLALGTVGRYSRNYANAAVRDADAILAIGTQLGGLVTDSYRLITPNAKLIHVSVDGESIGLNFPTHLGVVADARSFLEAVLRACDREDARASSASEAYLQKLTADRQAWHERRLSLASRDGNDGGPMRPEALMASLNEQIANDAVVVADTGYAAAWAGALTEVKVAGRQFLRSDGSLGWAFPGSLGAQLAVPDKQVICVIGDGGFGYHIGDLETALRLKLPVVVIILNNQTLAFEAHVQTLLYGHMVPEVDDFIDIDYGQVARAFGVAGVRVANVAEFNRALDDGLEGRVP